MFLYGITPTLKIGVSLQKTLPTKSMVDLDLLVVQKRALYLQIMMDQLVISNQDCLVLQKTMRHQKLMVLVKLALKVRLVSKSGCTIRQMVDGTSIQIDSVVDRYLDLIVLQKHLSLVNLQPLNYSVLIVKQHSRLDVVKSESVKMISWLEVEQFTQSSLIQLIEYSPSATLRLIEGHMHIMNLQSLMLKELTMDTLLTL